MEASEALRRIFWRHRWLLIALIVLPVAVVVPFLERQHPTFAATAHVQGSGQEPTVDTQIKSVQAQVTAVATNPAIMQQAIDDAHVNRDAVTMAKHHVSVSPLGTSNVMQLTLTDPNKNVAIALDGSLADRVVGKLAGLGIQNNPEISQLNKANQQLTTERDKLLAQLGSISTPNGQGSVQVQSLLTQLGAVEQQLSSNQSAAQMALNAVSSGAAVVGTPTYATGSSRHLVEYGALAGLLGLIIGLLISTIHELVRPTVAEPAAGARELETVFLGDAATAAGTVTGVDDDLVTRMEQAADRIGARTLILTGPVPRLELSALAYRLGCDLRGEPAAGNGADDDVRVWPDAHAVSYARTSGINGRSTHGSDATPPAGFGTGYGTGYGSGYGTDYGAASAGETGMPPVRVVAMPELPRGVHHQDPALIVVLPQFVPHPQLDRIADLGKTTGWPFLGVIGLVKDKAAPRHGSTRSEDDYEDAVHEEHIGAGVAR